MAWDRSLWVFGFGSVTSGVWLEIFGLGSFVWDVGLGGLGSSGCGNLLLGGSGESGWLTTLPRLFENALSEPS